jgi:hypothetical protein
MNAVKHHCTRLSPGIDPGSVEGWLKGWVNVPEGLRESYNFLGILNTLGIADHDNTAPVNLVIPSR